MFRAVVVVAACVACSSGPRAPSAADPNCERRCKEWQDQLVGRIVDQNTGAPVVGASIVLSGGALAGATRSTKTDIDGRFALPPVPDGDYQLRVFTAEVVVLRDVTLQIPRTDVTVPVDRKRTGSSFVAPTRQCDPMDCPERGSEPGDLPIRPRRR